MNILKSKRAKCLYIAIALSYSVYSLSVVFGSRYSGPHHYSLNGALVAFPGSSANLLRFISNDQVVGIDGGLLQTWDLNAGRRIKQVGLKSTWIVGFSGDGKYAVGFYEGRDSMHTAIWDSKGALKTVLKGREGLWDSCVALSPNGKTAFNSVNFNYDPSEKPIPPILVSSAWDTSSGKKLWSETVPASSADFLFGYPVTYSPDGKYIAQCQGARTLNYSQIVVRDARTYQKIRTLLLPGASIPSRRSRAHLGWKTIAFSPDSRRVATVSEVDRPHAQQLRDKPSTYTGPRQALFVWDLGSGNLTWKSPDSKSALENAIFSPNGKIIALSGDTNVKDDPIGGKLELWDTATGKLTHTLQRCTQADIDYSKQEAARWEASRKWSLLNPFPKRYGTVFNVGPIDPETISDSGRWSGLAFSPDGKKVAMGGLAGEIVVWPVP